MNTSLMTKSTYEQIIAKAYAAEHPRASEEFRKGLEQARNPTPLFGYFPPRWMLDYGAACAFLFARSGDARFAEQARDALFFYRDWLKGLPPDAASIRPEYINGIGPMEPVFHPSVFVPAVCSIRDALKNSDIDILVAILADTLRPIWRFPEWGGHNRAMLRAAGLSAAAQAFPDHPEANQWRLLADELAEESWGRWSIEDAMLYQPHWLRSLIRYAETSDRINQLKDMLPPRHHLKAMTQLISPLGILPDFGDSHWLMHSHWEWMACLEWGAGAYRDPVMKWAANQLFLGDERTNPTLYHAHVAMMAWNWCDESIASSEPINQTDALDDLVIKKLVWRTGWEPDATYACLNFRDEGDYGHIARDYLRTTLAVSAEKMHHGHADEGSINMLVHDRTLLLHESGYREQPPDGIYRSAVYHNRVVWRRGSPDPAEELLEFLRADGRYQPLRTERLYQTRVAGVEFSRVRASDENEGLVWDRSLIFIPELPCWIVIDGIVATRSAFRTLSSIWWATDLLASGHDWFEIHQRGVMDWQNQKNAAMLVSTPAVPLQSGRTIPIPFRRHFQDELALTTTWSGEHRQGRTVNFVTILWPHGYTDLDSSRHTAVEVITGQPFGRGIGVWLRWGGEERLFGTLNDLAVGVGQEDIRPSYTSDLGLTTYDRVSSDAAFITMRKGVHGITEGFINGTFYARDGKVQFKAPLNGMFQENRTDMPGAPARFRWESK